MSEKVVSLTKKNHVVALVYRARRILTTMVLNSRFVYRSRLLTVKLFRAKCSFKHLQTKQGYTTNPDNKGFEEQIRLPSRQLTVKLFRAKCSFKHL